MQGIAYALQFRDSQALPLLMAGRPMSMTTLQENFIQKLRYQMARHGMGTTAVASHFGIRPQSVDGWLRTGRAGKDKMQGLARLFGTSLAYWLSESDPESEAGTVASTPTQTRIEGGDILVWDKPEDLPADEERVWVDRWDYTCSAGDGLIQWEVRQKGALPFTLGFFQAIGSKPDNCKLLMVRGDSMEPFLFNRDMMMVDTSKTDIRDGQVYAVCFEGEALVKRVYKQGGGILVLNSYNDRNYPDKTVNPATAAQFEVIGEVVYRSGSGFAAM